MLYYYALLQNETENEIRLPVTEIKFDDGRDTEEMFKYDIIFLTSFTLSYLQIDIIIYFISHLNQILLMQLSYLYLSRLYVEPVLSA